MSFKYNLHLEPVEGWLSCQYDPAGNCGPTIVFMKKPGVNKVETKMGFMVQYHFVTDLKIEEDALGTIVIPIDYYERGLMRGIIAEINEAHPDHINIQCKHPNPEIDREIDERFSDM